MNAGGPTHTANLAEAIWIALTPSTPETEIYGVAAAQTFYQDMDLYNFHTGQCAQGWVLQTFLNINHAL